MPAAQALEALVPLVPEAAVASAVDAVVLADRQSREWVGPGLLGLSVIVLLGVATYLLWRNMNKQIRRVDFDSERRDDSGRGPDGGRDDETSGS